MERIDQQKDVLKIKRIEQKTFNQKTTKTIDALKIFSEPKIKQDPRLLKNRVEVQQKKNALKNPSKTRLLKNQGSKLRIAKMFVAARVKVRFRDEIAVLWGVPFLRRLQVLQQRYFALQCACGMPLWHSVVRTSRQDLPEKQGSEPCAQTRLPRPHSVWGG